LSRLTLPDVTDDIDLANDRFIQRYDALADKIASEYSRYFPAVDNPQEIMNSDDWLIRQEYLAMKNQAELLQRQLSEEIEQDMYDFYVTCQNYRNSRQIVNWKEGF